MTKPPIYLVDVSGFIHRAYYSRPALQATDGSPVSAVVGFLDMMGHLMKYAAHGRIGLCFDTRKPTWRHKLYPEYKANREEKPADLSAQFITVMQAADALALARIEAEGYEADDLLATYTRLAVERGHPVVIVSSDKDLMQIVRDDMGIVMFDPMKKTMLNQASVKAKWGVEPWQIGDVLAIGGDAADNIKGCPLVGPKTAAEYVAKWGDLDGVLNHVDEMTKAKRQNMIASAANLRLYRQLVQLRDDAPTPIPFEWIRPPLPDPNKMHAFLAWLGMNDVPEPLRRFM